MTGNFTAEFFDKQAQGNRCQEIHRWIKIPAEGNRFQENSMLNFGSQENSPLNFLQNEGNSSQENSMLFFYNCSELSDWTTWNIGKKAMLFELCSDPSHPLTGNSPLKLIFSPHSPKKLTPAEFLSQTRVYGCLAYARQFSSCFKFLFDIF